MPSATTRRSTSSISENPGFAWAEAAKQGLPLDVLRGEIALALQCHGLEHATIVLDEDMPESMADVITTICQDAWGSQESSVPSREQQTHLEQQFCECLRSGGRCCVTIDQLPGGQRLVLAAFTSRDRRRQRMSWIGVAQVCSDEASACRTTKQIERLGAAVQLALAQVQEIFAVGAFMVRNDAMDLSPRERECLQLVHVGYSSKQIANHIGLRVCTVDEYLHSATIKLSAHNRAHAANRAALLVQLRA